jgi:membrane protein YdbS with pleckstrin-like domain
MFKSWSLKSIIIVFLSLLLFVAILQVFMFLTNRSIITHFALSFIALFIALLLFHSLNIRLKSRKGK